jgi:CubicO group peptidase (beta-lactamase class C family)
VRGNEDDPGRVTVTMNGPMSELDRIAQELVAQAVAPVAAVGCAWSEGKAGLRSAVGGAVGTYFDLASLTKPMTAVAVARSGLGDYELAAVMPELSDTQSARATIELLLAHRAGLSAHLPLYAPLVNGETVDRTAAVRRAADARRDDARGPIPQAGFAPLYSDLGYILAGIALARHSGHGDAADAVGHFVVEPLGLTSTLGSARSLEARGVDLVARAAPTEVVAWRGGEVRGRVHDENAWALTGSGGSGHAGMFGTVSAVLRFGCAVLDALAGRVSPLSGRDLGWLVSERPGGTLRAGFDGKSDQASSAGARMGPRAFGHLGYTGTSLWIDPDASIIAVVLTNRVHPTRENLAIRSARPWAHDALFSHAEQMRPRSTVD